MVPCSGEETMKERISSTLKRHFSKWNFVFGSLKGLAEDRAQVVFQPFMWSCIQKKTFFISLLDFSPS